MVVSVAEGEDKPLKYPLMFRACELVVVNKIDLLPHVDFDMDRFARHLDAVHPGVRADAGERAHRRGRGRVPRLAGGVACPSGSGRVRTCEQGAGRAGALASARANERFFDAEAERIARLCHAMAERFARGGRLIAVGPTPRPARTCATWRSSSSTR